MALIDAVINGFPERREEASPCVGSFWAIRHDLSVDDGLVLYQSRIVIPQAARRGVVARLHAAHQGITRTQRRATNSLLARNYKRHREHSVILPVVPALSS